MEFKRRNLNFQLHFGLHFGLKTKGAHRGTHWGVAVPRRGRAAAQNSLRGRLRHDRQIRPILHLAQVTSHELAVAYIA